MPYTHDVDPNHPHQPSDNFNELLDEMQSQKKAQLNRDLMFAKLLTFVAVIAMCVTAILAYRIMFCV